MEGAGGRTTLLALQDASVHAPLGMYLHSRWVPLSRGPRPLLTGGLYARNLLCAIGFTAFYWPSLSHFGSKTLCRISHRHNYCSPAKTHGHKLIRSWHSPLARPPAACAARLRGFHKLYAVCHAAGTVLRIAELPRAARAQELWPPAAAAARCGDGAGVRQPRAGGGAAGTAAALPAGAGACLLALAWVPLIAVEGRFSQCCAGLVTRWSSCLCSCCRGLCWGMYAKRSCVTLG